MSSLRLQRWEQHSARQTSTCTQKTGTNDWSFHHHHSLPPSLPFHKHQATDDDVSCSTTQNNNHGQPPVAIKTSHEVQTKDSPNAVWAESKQRNLDRPRQTLSGPWKHARIDTFCCHHLFAKYVSRTSMLTLYCSCMFMKDLWLTLTCEHLWEALVRGPLSTWVPGPVLSRLRLLK